MKSPAGSSVLPARQPREIRRPALQGPESPAFSAPRDRGRQEIMPGVYAVPINLEADAPLAICIAFRRKPDAASGHFILLRDTFDAQVFLGCLLDSAGTVHRWLEVWVQHLTAIPANAQGLEGALNNRILDERWRQHAKALAELDPTLLIRTGWETAHRPPIWVDPQSLKAVHPVEAESAWRLCEDDHLLMAAGLPAYSASLHRYLYQPDRGEMTDFFPVTSEAPAPPIGRAADAVIHNNTWLPLNPHGGLMMIRAADGLPVEDYVRLLEGVTYEADTMGRALRCAVGKPVHPEKELQGAGWLYLGAHSRGSRLVETLHLKLRVLADVIDAVSLTVMRCRRPMLNLSASSFQVHLAEPGRGLPFLWTGRTHLVQPGDAVEVPLPDGSGSYYLPGRLGSEKTSVYQAGALAHPAGGRGVLRVARVLAIENAFVLEGILHPMDDPHIGPDELVRVWLNLSGSRLELLARLSRGNARAIGEYHVSTLSQPASQQLLERVRAIEGMSLPQVRYEVIPTSTTACDLYSLAVLAVRLFLVDARTSLAQALVQIQSLATSLHSKEKPDAPLAQSIQHCLASEDARRAALGPHHLNCEGIEPHEAFALVPAKLWAQLLGIIIRMIPGLSSESICSGWGDVPTTAIHQIFTPVAKELSQLLVTTRSLVLMDWQANREMHRALLHHLTGLSDDSTEPPIP